MEKPDSEKSTTNMMPDDDKTNEISDAPSVPWYKTGKGWLKLMIVLVVLTFIVIAIVFLDTTQSIIQGFLEWMADNIGLGIFAFIALYWFCTVMFIPGSLLTLGAGLIFRQIAGSVGGIFLGTLVVLIGAALGASTAFLLGRFVFREKVAAYKTKYQKFDIIDKVVEQQGLKVTILLRLSPLIPFSAFNYFMGLTGVSFRNYNIAHIGMLPGTMAYCFIGGTLGALGDSAGVGFGDPVVLIATIAGTVIAVVGMVYISFVAKKEFNKIASQYEDKAEDENATNDVENGGLKDSTSPSTEQGDDAKPPTDDAPPSYEDKQPAQNNEAEPEASLSLGN